MEARLGFRVAELRLGTALRMPDTRSLARPAPSPRSFTYASSEKYVIFLRVEQITDVDSVSVDFLNWLSVACRLAEQLERPFNIL